MQKHYMRTIIGFFWKRLCFNYLISTLWHEGWTFWWINVTTPNLHTGKRTNPILIQLNTILNIVLEMLTSLVFL